MAPGQQIFLKILKVYKSLSDKNIGDRRANKAGDFQS